MSAASRYTENALIEQPAIELFAELGWETVNGYGERFGPGGTLGREHKGEVVLVARLRAALERLNPGLPREAIESAIEEITRERGALSMVHANREVYGLLKDGVKVSLRGRRSEDELHTVRVVDWNAAGNNDFLLVSQFWVAGDVYTRRPDLVGFVNGLPLLLAELKAAQVTVRDAYDGNLRDYRDTIPYIFQYNALVILSNGSRSRAGTISAAWEHFSEWKKIDSEGEPGVISLETMIRGACEPSRLLDLVENFTLFSDVQGATVKLVAKNHQYLGVNNAFAAMKRLGENRGRLGVFWHTQGSGKSYSMIFFAQKVLRKLPGNWTFVIVTDRQELDDQIYRNFASAGAVTEPEEEIHADSGEHLRQLLGANHRTIFTLIQKFHAPKGETYPLISERSDIIVITDEAHRSQYDIFAANMRRALPNAAFIGFTGTPLMAGEEKTRDVFGDYVSIYNFRDSIVDGATVPLYYENRIPELQIVNEQLNEQMEELIEQAGLDEEQLERLEREFRREYHLITRDDRLETIAADIVAHIMGRAQAGKSMVVSIDKATAVRMHDKVRAYWGLYRERLAGELAREADPARQDDLREKIAFMDETDMAVVVSQGQNEVEDFRAKGLEILPHRRRMINEDLAEKFKDKDDPFRVVFVCAMWMTGFDVQTLSTIYLDKPMRNHTLMQTIARANRVFPGKLNGLIVDYIGVFRDLQRALAIYGSAVGGGVEPGDSPVRDKSELVEELRGALAEAVAYCRELGVELPEIAGMSTGWPKLSRIDDAVELILENDETRRTFSAHANRVRLLYRAILPDASEEEFRPALALLEMMAAKIRAETPTPDISGVMEGVASLLDESIATEGYVIEEQPGGYVDLSQIDFEALARMFQRGKRNTATTRLRSAIERQLARMVTENRSRVDYLRQFQELIDEYNRGSQNVQLFFERLRDFARELSEEDSRHIAEQLSVEELAVFDLLTRPDPGLTAAEEKRVKDVARDLLDVLKREKLVLDWRKRQQSRADVLVTIQKLLDDGLPPRYETADYEQRCEALYQHVYESYWGAGRSVYTAA